MEYIVLTIVFAGLSLFAYLAGLDQGAANERRRNEAARSAANRRILAHLRERMAGAKGRGQ